MAATAPHIHLGTPAPNFRLPATDGKTYALDDIAGKKGTVIVFICTHCPYVKAVIGRMVADARTLMAESIGFAAICSNDTSAYPEDSFDNMQRFAQTHKFRFHTCTMKTSRWRGPMARSAPPTSSATMPNAS